MAFDLHAPRPTTNKQGPLIWIVGLVAAAALILGVINLAEQQTPSAANSEPAKMPTQTFTATDQSIAKDHICATFAEVVASVKTATNASDGSEPMATSVNARAAITAGALALNRSLSPAAPPAVASAANKLVDAYSRYLLTAFQERTQNDADRAEVDDAASALRRACT